jgi:protein-S-isoprenylcysteine O-methyltransferase Ste14
MKIATSASVVIRILLWLVMLVGGAVFSIYKDLHHPLFGDISFHIFTAVIGLFVSTLAFRAAANGGRELKKGRVGDIPRLETNRLVTTGIYSCMRHPMLFGLTLLPLGWALLLGSPTFITFIAPLEMIFILFMVLIFEEMEVKKKYSAEYEIYKKETPMINFSYRCLRELFKGK